MARRRQLSPEERLLWRAVAKTARPMHEGAPLAGSEADFGEAAAAPPPGVTGGTPALPEVRLSPLPQFRLGERAPVPQRTGLADSGSTVLRMDAKTHHRMVRGRMAPEARIDLHGMTLSQAHPELIAFLMSAHLRGLRLVLVITGKGKLMHEPVPRPMGALRHQVPHWMRLQPLASVVQQVSEAHLKHGGAGAFYVWLRRR